MSDLVKRLREFSTYVEGFRDKSTLDDGFIDLCSTSADEIERNTKTVEEATECILALNRDATMLRDRVSATDVLNGRLSSERDALTAENAKLREARPVTFQDSADECVTVERLIDERDTLQSENVKLREALVYANDHWVGSYFKAVSSFDAEKIDAAFKAALTPISDGD